MEYKKLYIQQQTYNGSIYTDVGPLVETQESYNVVCKEFPFKVLPEAKEPASRDWHDENGEDVFIPTGGLKFKAYDLDVTFMYVGSQANVSEELTNFINFIYGRNTGGSSLLAVFDEYTMTGRRGIYVKSVDDDFLLYDDVNPEVVGEFKVKFKVTEPTSTWSPSSSSSLI